MFALRSPFLALRSRLPAHLSLLILLSSGCVALAPSDGGGQTEFQPPRLVDPADVALPEGYRIEAVAADLTFPTGVAFDSEGRPYVTEAGYSYGEVFLTPRLLRIEDNGRPTEIARGDNPPWNGVTFHDGAFFVAGGHTAPGQILRIGMEGSVTPVVSGLPSMGDHHTNGPVVGPDGWIYFGQGTATNSGIVGEDNYEFGWLQRHPEFHDIPCRDITLAGRNHTGGNPLTPDRDDQVTTGAFVPFGTPTPPGQVVPGALPCSGAIMRVPVGGGALELVAWGFRNPFGLAFSPEGALYVTENQYDVRGSRPVWGVGDLLWRVEGGTWYGWPDYYAGIPLDSGNRFEAPDKPGPKLLLSTPPNQPPRPAASFGVHASANGIDFSRNDAFGHAGEAFVAQFGDMAPRVGKVLDPVGFRVVRANTETGVVHDFVSNRGKKNGPASWIGSRGLERPVAVRFDPSGMALYIVDFGVMLVSKEGILPQPGTGVLWRVTRIP